jgi:hypothetical protein
MKFTGKRTPPKEKNEKSADNSKPASGSATNGETGTTKPEAQSATSQDR